MNRRPLRSHPPASSDPRSAALRLLTRRDYTTIELDRKLTDRGYAPEAVAAAIESLVQAGVLDDRRVGAAHVRTASRIKGRGKLRIARELEARGLPSALVRELTSALSADDESAAIARMVARMRLQHPLDRPDRQRIFSRLLRRGFSSDAVSKALRFRPDEE